MAYWSNDDIQRPAIRVQMAGEAWSLAHTIQDAILACVLCMAALGASAVAGLMVYAALLALVGWLGL